MDRSMLVDGKELDCKGYAASLTRELEEAKFDRALVSINTSKDSGSLVYQRLLGEDCEVLGVAHRELYAGSHDELLEKIGSANIDSGVGGILLFYPLGEGISGKPFDYANKITPRKDLEGLNRLNLGSLYQKFTDRTIVPSTAGAVVKVLQHHSFGFSGNALSINRSEVIGRPLRTMLEHLGMTAHCVWDRTHEDDVKTYLGGADLVVTAVPGNKYRIPVEHVKENSVVVAVNSNNIKGLEAELDERNVIRTSRIGVATRKVTLLNLLKLAQI